MAKTCGDCYWSYINTSNTYYHEWKCKKKLFGSVDSDDRACSNFRSRDTHACWECDYFESGSHIWNKTGLCTLKGVKRHEDDKSCSCFFE